MTERSGADPEFFDAVEEILLGRTPHLSRRDVIDRTGITRERARALWLALGFPSPASDDEVLFTDADMEAIELLRQLGDAGVIEPRVENALTRSMGRSFSRLAEWEVAEVAGLLLDGSVDPQEESTTLAPEEARALIETVLPPLARLQEYVWRRHLAGAAGRLLLQAAEDDVTQTVGFADIVGYTRRTRSLDQDELADMVERFESTVNQVISDHGGRIIKTIGDEVLFVTDEPVAAARIALGLAAAHGEDDGFPQVRVGLAHGRVLSRLGDVYGEVVNIAARLTSVARPGRVLADRALADILRDHEQACRVRRARVVPVRGYRRLETWTLKPPRPTDVAVPL